MIIIMKEDQIGREEEGGTIEMNTTGGTTEAITGMAIEESMEEEETEKIIMEIEETGTTIMEIEGIGIITETEIGIIRVEGIDKVKGELKIT